MIGLVDGHIHATKELLSVLKKNCVYCIANSDNLQEYEWLKNANIPEMIVSVGIHPWKADVTDWQEMETILREAKVIGEIGLDNVWCNVDMETQRKVFLKQLELARDSQKPVILHTKGMEKEILEIIREFPNRYLVHWYSCENYLEEYIKMGCWFTVGPAILQDKSVEAVARKVPIERLLIESDGLEGISWGQNREIRGSDYIEAMEKHLYTVADICGCKVESLLKQMKQNFVEFIQG
ncbi:MAG: TatD family hydrolase [Roseburia sp.]|nr:TatD family hydrolase [Roseburia sp.]